MDDDEDDSWELLRRKIARLKAAVHQEQKKADTNASVGPSGEPIPEEAEESDGSEQTADAKPSDESADTGPEKAQTAPEKEPELRPDGPKPKPVAEKPDPSPEQLEKSYETAKIEKTEVRQAVEQERAPPPEPAQAVPEKKPEQQPSDPETKEPKAANEMSEEQRKAILTSQVLKAIRFPSRADTEKQMESTRAKLEEALAGNTPTPGARFTPSGREAKFFQAAINHLVNQLPDLERAMLVVKAPDGDLVAAAVCQVEKEYLDQTSRRMLTRILSQNKPTMMPDALQDPYFSSDSDVKKNRLRSVLCVPFRYPKENLRGLLYADNRNQVGAFTYDDLNRLKEFADQLEAGEFAALEALTAAPTALETTVIPLEPPAPQSYLWVGAVALLLLIVMCSAPKIEPPAPTPTVGLEAPTLETRPFGLTQSFLQQLKSKKFAEARELFSDRLRRQLSAETLERRVQSWNLESPERQVTGESIDGFKGTVEITCPDDGSAKTWTWKFVRQGGDWKLDELHP